MSTINSNDTINAMPPPPAGKGQNVKKKAKPSSSADRNVKIESDSYVRTGDDEYIQSAGSGNIAKESVEERLITAGEIFAFVDEYNRLPEILGGGFFPVRAEVYKPVRLNGQENQISLYEIGIAHSPNRRYDGVLSVDEGTLTTALQSRGADVHSLFLQAKDGLLERLCLMIMDKKGAEPFLRFCAGIKDKYTQMG